MKNRPVFYNFETDFHKKIGFFMSYSFTSHIAHFDYDEVWHYHFKVPDTIAEKLWKKSKRVVCTINGKHTYQCGLLSAGKRGYFININKTIRKKLGVELHDEVEVELQPDTSTYGLPVPESFQELLKQDPEFDKVFHSLTKGKQRSLIHYIGKFKSEEKQLEKALIIRDYLIRVEGKLNFKELMQAFKTNRYL